MTFTLWLSLLIATVVISITPGAGAINTMTNAIQSGWRRAFWGIAGQQVALIVHIVIVAAGVGLIVANSPVLFEIIRYTGAAYLVYLGLRLLFARVEPDPIDDVVRVKKTESRLSMLRRGFWVNILNPKAIVFFLAFVPQFIKLDKDPWPQYITLILTVLLVDIIIMWFFFALAARPFRRAIASARGQQKMNRVFGTMFVTIAALLVVH